MKKIILCAVAIALSLSSCNQKTKEVEVEKVETTKSDAQLYACSMHPEVTGQKDSECPKCGMKLTEPVVESAKAKTQDDLEGNADPTAAVKSSNSFSVNELVTIYLKLKNALVKDDAKGAAAAGKNLYSALNSVNATSLDAKLKKDYTDIADDAKEHAQHIGDNATKIAHQREHFAMLSKDMNDLIKTFGTTQKLYQDYCPMYNEGKSGYWISETKDIKNPYYGSQMLTCGAIKKTF